MKRIIAITAAVVVLVLAAAACGGGGSVTIPSRVGAVETEPASVETYCALESEARRALKPFLRDGASPVAAVPALAKASSLAAQVAVVAPDAIAGELSTRSRAVANLFGAVRTGRYDVGMVAPRPALVIRSQSVIGALDRIEDYDLRVCNIAI